MKFVVRSAFALLVCVVAVAPAWGQVTIPQEYGKTIKSAEAVGALGPNLFGDQTSFYTGATTFSATDVSLPGNNALPVSVGRRFVVQSRDSEAINNLMSADGMFADWELDIPHLHGIFSAGVFGGPSGWQVKNFTPLGGEGDPNLRCSAEGLQEPPVATGSFSGLWEAGEYWHGYNAYIPGVGDQEMLDVKTSNPHQPTDGKTYKWVTNNQWYFSCLPNTANGVPGEAFLAISPDGTRYWFDWFASREASTIVKEKGPVQGLSASGESTTSTTDATSSDQVTTMAPVGDKTGLSRVEVWILPTRVEDRFGNYVTYTYDAAHPWRLTSIAANDGRQLTLGYNTSGRISTVTDGTRTWTYVYASVLNEVHLPDASKWVINFGAIRDAYTAPQPNQSIVAFCEQPSSNPTQPVYTGTITHPSGAVGEFQFQSKLHGRSYVPKVCIKPDPYGSADYAHNPFYFDTVGLIQKKISGPGLPVAQWTYSYGPPNNSWAENCPNNSCVATKTVEVTGPGDFVRYTFGNKYLDTDGKLLKVETGSSPTNILKTETTTYLLDPTNQAYPSQVGRSPYLRGDRSAEKLTPTTQRQITQQGTTFTWQANQTNGVYSFDQFANPLSVTRSSSLGYSQTNVTEYEHNTGKWVLGQVKKLTTDGIEVSRTNYHAVTALPTASYSFDKLQHSATYYTDGTLRQLTDGRNYTTTFSAWNRGIPELIQYPATPDQPSGASVSAHANTLGWIEWAKDENGYKTCYGYDAMGRLASIIHPSETTDDTCDTSKWNQTTQTFAPVPLTPEYGIAGGHWKQTVSTGNARKVSYFDAMWRPLVTESYDNLDATNTRSVSVTRYDAGGHPVFQSYALRTLTDYATVTQGQHTTYDALDRVTQSQQNWESDAAVGLLTTTTEYLTGFQTRVTNPRGHAITTSYYVYDQPTQDLPRVMLLPEGARTTVYRDVFGKPTTLVRSNADSSVWNGRYYVYDANQQLCKRVELETGTTAMGYDAAGNLAWSAAGLPWSSTTDCTIDTTGRRADRTYDARNRLKTLSFPDGVGNQVWTYTPDSKPDQITTYNATNNGVPVINAYHYNRRRMLDGQGESISQPEWYTWGLGYGYDANGNLASHVYPNSVTVDYAPNALGQPAKVGTYATGVNYHPNGAIAQFTYGNGIVHTLLQQNTRPLPDRSKDAYNGIAVLDDSYDFDANGNVAAISDGLTGANGDRTMTYDGLDRLKTTTSPMLGGTITYGYDVLDNLTTLVDSTRNLRYCYNANQRLEFVRAGATDCNTGAAQTTFDYDVQGNLDHKNSQNYDFDFGNRLRTVTGKELYRYDGHGRRALAWAPGYANGNILSQYDMGGVLRYQQDTRQNKYFAYFYLGGSLVAIRETPIGTSNHVVKYQHTDALGSPVAVTDANRVVLERSDYEPYGKLLNRPIHDGPGYTGHVEDAATGLTYMQQRYYDPGIGRFLSVDPVTANGTGGNFNRYWYANNNPYKFVDPDGRNGELLWTAPDQVTVTFNYVMTGVNPQFTPAQLNAQVAQNFSGNVTVNGVNVTVTAQAVQVTNPAPGQVVNTVNVVPNTAGVTQSGRSETNAIGGNQVTLGATGPDAATAVTGSHEVGHGLGAGDQYAGGLGANRQTLQADVPGAANIMKDLSGANANSQTLGEIIRAPTNVNSCAQGVSAASGGC